MKKTFLKMHGLGNDFAVFDGRESPLKLPEARIRTLADRHTGIGFDQLVIIGPPASPDVDASLKIFNADGGEVGACGNASRCVADLLIKETGKNKILLETIAAKLEALAHPEGVTVDMGKVYLDWKDIPLSYEINTLSLPATWGELNSPVAVNVGNPHTVFFVSNVESVKIEDIGPRVETHTLFPKKTNVEFAEVINPETIRMRVWERGAGITRACGTGACATAVAGFRRGLTGRKVKILLDGGALDIEWRESDNHVLMTGPVALVYRGEIEI